MMRSKLGFDACLARPVQMSVRPYGPRPHQYSRLLVFVNLGLFIYASAIPPAK